MKQGFMKNVSLKGIVAAVPKEKRTAEDFTEHFSMEEIQKTASVTGVQEVRVAPDDVCTSDLCVAAAEKLIDKLTWEKESIDCLIFVSQTPDYILPATSCIIQERLGLSTECAAFDVNQGCSGYVYALWLGANLLESGSMKRIILLVGDTISKLTNPADRATSMLFGDAGTATAIEWNENAKAMGFVLGSDGKGAENLIVKRGHARFPSVSAKEADENETMDKNYLYMDGGEIFNFTIKRVPKMVKEVMEIANKTNAEIDYFLFHQANEFIMKHLAKKIKATEKQLPISLQQFGNTSSASIPLTIVSQITLETLKQHPQLVLAGFGVGYSWAAACLNVCDIEVLDLMEV